MTKDQIVFLGIRLLDMEEVPADSDIEDCPKYYIINGKPCVNDGPPFGRHFEPDKNDTDCMALVDEYTSKYCTSLHPVLRAEAETKIKKALFTMTGDWRRELMLSAIIEVFERHDNYATTGD